MYAVVGCSECAALWVLEGRPETSECPRCGSRRSTDRRRTFVRAEDPDAAREARARLLAERQDEAAAFEAVEDFAALEADLDAAGPDDETYLAGSGLDPERIADAGERATAPSGGRSRQETVRAAVRELSEPDAEAVRAFCAERGVPGEAAESILQKLVRAGEVTETDGAYRLL